MDKKIVLQQMLRNAGIEKLTPMQQQSLKTYAGGGNLILLSPTGSGKTLAYLLPLMLDLLERSSMGDAESQEAAVQALVLVPSRELAIQTEQVFKQLGTELRAVSCYGGRPTMDEHRTLRGVNPQVVIATPGRINDHIGKGNIQTKTIRVLVIDEFDKCLELGFREEMASVIKKLPNLKRRFLLSATDAEEIPAFANTGKEPLRLDYLEHTLKTENRISLHLVRSQVKDKLDVLLRLLCAQGAKSSIVFVNYRDAVERVGKYLKSNHIYTEEFHGGMEQKDRERALYKFSNGSCNVLVSTDLASRGLDIPEVDNIIHYHLPVNQESYTHRNGRTARWEAEGNSFIILGPEESLPEYIHQQMEEIELPETMDSPQPPMWVTLYIGKGKKDKISKADILGFLCQIGGLDKQAVGKIDVKDHYAFVAIHRNVLKETLTRIRDKKIKGMKTLVEVTK